MISNVFIVFLTCAFILQLKGQSIKQSGSKPLACNAQYPNLSVGDIQLSDNNFYEFKKNNKLYILGISDSDCPQCCTTEDLLNSLQKDFQAGLFKFKVLL